MPFKCTLSNDMGEGWKGVTFIIIEDQRISVESKFLNFGLGDINSYTHDAVYVHF